jgi:RNA polymerase sigma-70 factor, ECF subfamily
VFYTVSPEAGRVENPCLEIGARWLHDPNDDAALVARAKADSAAFGELYERYVGRIYSYLYYRTSNAHDAEDLTARVFQRALTGLNGYTSRGLPFSAWLYRIAHNLVANWHRDQGRRQHLPLHELGTRDLRIAQEMRGPSGEAPETLAETQEEQARLMRAIRRLSEERQQLLVLKFVEQLSNAEIGVVLDRSEGAVKSLYHRTLLALRDDLSDRPDGTAPGPGAGG